MDELKKAGGTVQTILDSVQTQLRVHDRDSEYTQYTQYTNNAVTPLCWETDVTAAGGRLTDMPPFPPVVYEIQEEMKKARKGICNS